MAQLTDLGGWKIDLESIYASFWKRRGRFHLREWVKDAPTGDRAVLFYGIGEIGLNKQVGMVALLRTKSRPEIVLLPKKRLFWFEGPVDEPLRFDDQRPLAFVTEYTVSWWSKKIGARPRVIDLVAGRLQ